MTPPNGRARPYRRALDHDFLSLHTAKEDAFWAAKMGLVGDADAAHAALRQREAALQAWLQDPGRLAEARRQLVEAEAQAGAESGGGADAARVAADDLLALRGWERCLAAHVIESAEARALGETLLEQESRLAAARSQAALGYTLDGAFQPAGFIQLTTMLRAEPVEAKRRAAWRGLRRLEQFVLEHGYLEIVKTRNRFARLLGREDYYDWKCRRVEGVSKHQVFALLDELEARTRAAGQASLAALAASPASTALASGAGGRAESSGGLPLAPWNALFQMAGAVTLAQDPYFPFADAFSRWGRGFAALGVSYRGATLALDLLNRPGKYENGFMHGPEPAWRDQGVFRPARVHFTANAIPGLAGNGRREAETFYHEGGHAAHFANVDMPSPCFAHEFAPMSAAHAELQSMFFDDLLGDADWQTRYARDARGEAMPWELIARGVADRQPFAAWDLRNLMTVCYAERAIYELPERDLTPERVLDAVRQAERRLLFLEEGRPLPVLAVPHLLDGDASANYHGYVLALMGVAQTRRHFLARDGFLTDNPRIGPELAEGYWRPGNSRGYLEFVQSFTGRDLSAAPLADEAGRSVATALAEARAAHDRALAAPRAVGEVRLDARVRVVHGREEIVDTATCSFERAAERFAAWVTRQAT